MNRNFGWKALLSAVILATSTAWLAAQGQGYSTPVEVSDGGLDRPDFVEIAADPTGVNVLWREHLQGQFLFRRAADGGTTFATDPATAFPPKPLISITLCRWGDDFAAAACPTPDHLAVDGSGHVYVIAETQVGDLWGLLFSRSTDYGGTFSDPISLYMDEENYFEPEEAQIGVDADGHVTVVWTTDNEQMFLRRSTDAGLTFGDPIELPSLDDYPHGLQMALDSAGNVNLVWAVSPNILFTRLVNGPDGLELQPYVVFPAGGTDSTDPQIAIGPDGSINVTWHERSSGGSRILFSRSLDAGLTFSGPSVVTVTASAWAPQLAMGQSGTVNIAWEEWTEFERAVFFGRSVDGGATFSFPVKVLQSPRAKGIYSTPPQLAVDAADNSHIVWTAYDKDATGPWMTLVTRSVGNALSFSEPQPLVGVVKSLEPTNPKIAADEQGSVTVAWLEEHRVFIATFTAGSTPTGEDVVVQPIDPTTGTAPVTVTFTDVTEPGETTVVTSSQGPPPTGAFKLGTPPVYYEISTTATVTFPVNVCIDYSGSDFNNEDNLTLGHWTGTGWEMLDPTSLDTEHNIICADVMSFSTFAVFEKGYEFGGFLPPVLVDGSAVFKSGRTVPVKFFLRDQSGTLVIDATARLSVFKISNGIEGTVPVEVESTSSSSSGDLFRVDPSTGQYIYNLSTQGYQGTFLIRVTLDDGTTHEVRFSAR